MQFRLNILFQLYSLIFSDFQKIMRHQKNSAMIFLVTGVVASLAWITAAAADRPNILWITSEDNGAHLGAYGDKFATTPHLESNGFQVLLFSIELTQSRIQNSIKF